MSNVLNRAKQEQIRALGRLGWSVRRIGEEVGVHRETVSRHLKAAGVVSGVRGSVSCLPPGESHNGTDILRPDQAQDTLLDRLGLQVPKRLRVPSNVAEI